MHFISKNALYITFIPTLRIPYLIKKKFFQNCIFGGNSVEIFKTHANCFPLNQGIIATLLEHIATRDKKIVTIYSHIRFKSSLSF